MKAEELFLAGDISTDGSGERATGLYLRDTRHLDAFTVRLNGAKPATLAVRYHGHRRAVVTTTNSLLTLDDGQVLAPQRIMLLQEVEIGHDLRVSFTVENFTSTPWSLRLDMELGADFRDLFDIRGFPRAERGTLQRPALDGSTVRFGYHGLDDTVAETVVQFDREPKLSLVRVAPSKNEAVPVFPSLDWVAIEDGAVGEKRVRATYAIDLAPREQWKATVTVDPRPPADRPRVELTDPSPGGCRIVTSDPVLNAALDRAAD